MKIYIKKVFNDTTLPKIISKGDWIDLHSVEDVTFNHPVAFSRQRKTANGITTSTRKVCFDSKKVHLGIAMKLPDGFEAILAPRSSTFSKYNVMQTNSIGVIDNTYCGNGDEWMVNMIAFDSSEIHKGDRICQFRIQLSQNATIWQKIKWFFTNKIELVEVDTLSETNRGGFGSTGK